MGGEIQKAKDLLFGMVYTEGDYDQMIELVEKLVSRAENTEKALNDAGDVIASIVACCTYGSEEQAKAGAYGISHEAFTRIDTFIRKYGDLLQAIDPKKGGE